MKGFILAGGEGTRMRPITYEIPKPLLTVGKIPILTYLVRLFLKNGITDIKIGIQKSQLKDYRKWQREYFPAKKIGFALEAEPSGTFTPVAKNVSSKWFSEPIVVSNGDELKELNLKKMIDWHLKRKAVATVGLVKVAEPSAYGVARMAGDKIAEFVEKPKNPPSSYINSGLYVLDPEIRKYYPKGAKFAMVESDLFPQLAKEGKLHGYKWQGKWFDCGNFSRWETAIKLWPK